MKDGDPKELPLVREMPVIRQDVLEELRTERGKGHGTYWYLLGADFVRSNPAQKKAYEESLKGGFPEKPNATPATVLYVWKALDMQAEAEGFKLPQIPHKLNPSPALRDFWSKSDGTEESVIGIAYDELLTTNPLMEDIVQDIAEGAPDVFYRELTVEQAKRGVVYAYYGLKSILEAGFE